MTTDERVFSFCSSTCHTPVAGQPSLHPRLRQSGWNGASGVLHNTHNQPPNRIRRAVFIQKRRTSSVPSRPWKSMHSFIFAVIFGILLCCHGVDASSTHSGSRLRRAELLFDRSERPLSRAQLERRDELTRLEGSPLAVRDSIPGPFSHGLLFDTSSAQFPLPSPFDSNLGNNFTTSSCPAFFQSFLNSEPFKQCLPFSLLLQVCQPTSGQQRHPTNFTTDFSWILRCNTPTRRAREDLRCNMQRRLQHLLVAHSQSGPTNTARGQLRYRPSHAEPCRHASIQRVHGIRSAL